MPTPIPHNVPTGGFHCYEAGEKLDGHSVDDLARQIATKRRLRGVQPGNPRADVEDYICRHNPADCTGWPSAAQNVASAPDGYETLMVTQWMNSFIGSVFPLLVDAPTAQNRAETGCVGCPHNKPYGCCQNKQPKGALATGLGALRQSRDVARYGSEMFACSALGYDTRTAVWLYAGDLHLPAVMPELPKRCWVPGALQSISADANPSPNYP